MEMETPEPSMQLLAEAAETQPHAPVLGEVDGDQEDSRSSSLSEPEDGPATEPSEAADESDAPSEDDEDTEAETERLELSPDKQRKQRKVLLGPDAESGNEAALDVDNTEQIVEDKTHGIANDEDKGEEQAGEVNLQTSEMSSPVDSPEASDQEDSQPVTGRKRKREEDDDTTANSLKKVALELANHVADQEEATEEAGSPQDSVSGIGDVEMNEDEEEEDEDEEEPIQEDRGEEQTEEGQGNEDNAEAADVADSNIEDVEGEEGVLDAMSAAKTQEELEKRKAALETLSSIERDFALLRDKLFADRSSQLAQEMATIDTDSPSHPLHLSVLGWLNQLREEKVEYAKTLFRYKVGALQRRAITNRAAAQGQYIQRMRELRDQTLDKASADWYQIQRERRNFDADNEVPINQFVPDRLHLVATQNAYNLEVSILSGISKYVGFPAAPDITGAKSTDIDEDLKKMGISRQAAGPTLNPGLSQASRPKSGAEEQFIAETAWANPQHQQSQYLTNIHRQVSNGPVNTPAAPKQPVEQVPNDSASTIATAPNSSFGPTPMSNSEAVNAQYSRQANNPDSTPSKPPELDRPLNLLSESKSGNAEEQSGLDGIEQNRPIQSTAHKGRIIDMDADANRRNAASPDLLAAQAPKDTPQDNRMPAQFTQGAALPPVKV